MPSTHPHTGIPCPTLHCLPSLLRVPITRASGLPHISIAPCACHIQHQVSPVCPSPRASNLPPVPIAHGVVPVPSVHHLWPSSLPFVPVTQGVVPVPRAHHPWHRVPTARGIRPPPSPAGAIDPVAWGAMLEDDRLTWPPSQVGCPLLQAPSENLRCQELHWVPAPTLSLPPLCHIV